MTTHTSFKPSLTLTSLEDRCLAASLAAPHVFTPPPLPVDVPAKVAHLPAPDADDASKDEPRRLGLRINRNETFVRRRKPSR